MKCPTCGKWMPVIKRKDTGNYIQRKYNCTRCRRRKTTYEFLADDIPEKFLQKGTRILIGDNGTDIVPAIYFTNLNSIYPFHARDDDGDLQGKAVIPLNWDMEEF